MAGELLPEILKSPRARIWGERTELQEIKAERTPKGELRGNSEFPRRKPSENYHFYGEII